MHPECAPDEPHSALGPASHARRWLTQDMDGSRSGTSGLTRTLWRSDTAGIAGSDAVLTWLHSPQVAVAHLMTQRLRWCAHSAVPADQTVWHYIVVAQLRECGHSPRGAAASAREHESRPGCEEGTRSQTLVLPASALAGWSTHTASPRDHGVGTTAGTDRAQGSDLDGAGLESSVACERVASVQLFDGDDEADAPGVMLGSVVVPPPVGWEWAWVAVVRTRSTMAADSDGQHWLLDWEVKVTDSGHPAQPRSTKEPAIADTVRAVAMTVAGHDRVARVLQ